jgi:hypothetical protein
LETAVSTSTKTCGDCGLCCKLMGVKPLAKAPHQWCVHYRRKTGCAIYADRPAECGAFVCYWMKIDSLGPEWRPDRAKFVIHLTDEGQTMAVEVDPGSPDAWTRQPYLAQFQAWARAGAAKGLAIRIWIGERCIALEPHGPVDMGRQRSLAMIAADLAG